jgi:hypothetical protein
MREPLAEADEQSSTGDSASQSIRLDHRATGRIAPTAAGGRRRGKPPLKLEAVKRAMKSDLESGRRTSDDLRAMLEKNLSEAYNVSRDTARRARAAVLSEFVEK